jgi:SpoVK/Ycf46/Vps4 family AAA+-type ATPase
MAKLFKACEALGGAIIFLDELDSLATSRDRADLHEASRRVLGVLLREIDGFENSSVAAARSGDQAACAVGNQKPGAPAAAAADGGGGVCSSSGSVLIGATNRRQDLDAALLSRSGADLSFWVSCWVSCWVSY